MDERPFRERLTDLMEDMGVIEIALLRLILIVFAVAGALALLVDHVTALLLE